MCIQHFDHCYVPRVPSWLQFVYLYTYKRPKKLAWFNQSTILVLMSCFNYRLLAQCFLHWLKGNFDWCNICLVFWLLSVVQVRLGGCLQLHQLILRSVKQLLNGCQPIMYVNIVCVHVCGVYVSGYIYIYIFELLNTVYICV